MPAGFGGGNQRQPGDYVTQIVDVKAVIGKDFNDKSKSKEQFEWIVNEEIAPGQWASGKIWTSRNFTDMSKVTDPKFVSALNRLVRACGMPVPTSEAEAKAWDENEMIGKRFLQRIEEEVDEETGATVRRRRYLPLREEAAAQPTPAGSGRITSVHKPGVAATAAADW